MGIRMLEANKIRISANTLLIGRSHMGIAIEGGRECLVHRNQIKKYMAGNAKDIRENSLQGGVFLYKRNEKFDCSANSITENTIEGFKASINVLCAGQYAEPIHITKNQLSSVFLKEEGASIIEENTDLQGQISVDATLY